MVAVPAAPSPVPSPPSPGAVDFGAQLVAGADAAAEETVDLSVGDPKEMESLLHWAIGACAAVVVCMQLCMSRLSAPHTPARVPSACWCHLLAVAAVAACSPSTHVQSTATPTSCVRRLLSPRRTLLSSLWNASSAWRRCACSSSSSSSGAAAARLQRQLLVLLTVMAVAAAQRQASCSQADTPVPAPARVCCLHSCPTSCRSCRPRRSR